MGSTPNLAFRLPPRTQPHATSLIKQDNQELHGVSPSYSAASIGNTHDSVMNVHGSSQELPGVNNKPNGYQGVSSSNFAASSGNATDPAVTVNDRTQELLDAPKRLAHGHEVMEESPPATIIPLTSTQSALLSLSQSGI